MMNPYNVRPIRRGRALGCLVAVAAIIALVGSVVGFVFFRPGSGFLSGTTLSVGAHPTIIGDSCGDMVFVQAGAENQVTITDSGTYEYTQDSASNTIEFTSCENGLKLTVPPETNLQIDTSDEITVLGVSGVMQLSANGSRITLEEVTLQGGSKIDDNGGALVFSGSIAQGSSSTLSDNGGSIDVTLRTSASLHLALTGILGPIASNVPGVQTTPENTSGFKVDVGSNPGTTTLTLELNDTSVVFDQ
jgi:hypothetical protein